MTITVFEHFKDLKLFYNVSSISISIWAFPFNHAPLLKKQARRVKNNWYPLNITPNYVWGCINFHHKRKCQKIWKNKKNVNLTKTAQCTCLVNILVFYLVLSTHILNIFSSFLFVHFHFIYIYSNRKGFLYFTYYITYSMYSISIFF